MVRAILLLGLVAAASTVVDAQVYGEWTCDEETGEKTRTVRTWNKFTKKWVETVEQTSCDPVNCVTYTKETDPGPWGDCAKEWDGRWNRYKTLTVLEPARWGGKCKPARIKERCQPVACVVNTNDEETTNKFGACAKEADGLYYRYKTLGIKTAALYGGTCPTEAQRQFKEQCKPVACVVNTADTETLPYGDCKETKDGWYQYRTLAVTKDALYGGSCPTEAQREDKKYCEPVPCVVNLPAEEITNEFSDCVQEGAVWNRYKTLGIKTGAKYGGSCPAEAQRQHKELCEPVKCVINTPEEESVPFGACQRESDGWYKYRPLGIKTQALYGGSCPSESDASRRQRVKCTRTCRSLQPSYGIGSASYYETKLSAVSSNNCCELCKARPKCEAYVFYTNTRQCWIQSALRTQFRSATAMGGTVVSK